MSATDQPSEEELRAAYEAELKQIRVEQILFEQVVTLVNLGMRKTGMAPGTEDERDLGQVRIAIDGVRALTPLLEQAAPEQIQPIRDALSQLQLAYVRLGGGTAAGPHGAADPGAGVAGPGAGAAGPGAGVAGPGAGAAGPGATPPASPGTSGGQPPTGSPASPDPGESGEPGPAQRSGRLWVPGQ
jgi:hypothetical protein